MAANYGIAIFVFAYFILNGEKRLTEEKFRWRFIGVMAGAVLVRFSYVVQCGFSVMALVSTVSSLLSGYLVYLLAKKHYAPDKSVIYMGLYLFNPVFLMYAYEWQNYLANWMLLILVIVYCIEEGQLLGACIAAGICQYYYIESLWLLPVLIMAISKKQKMDQKAGSSNIKGNKYKERSSKSSAGKMAVCGIGYILPVILLAAVYIWMGDQSSLLERLGTFFIPPYMAYNACNFWSLIGCNWKEIGIKNVSVVLKGLAVIGCWGYVGLLGGQWKKHSHLYIKLGLMISLISFWFDIGVHENYFLAAVMFCFLWSLYDGRKESYRFYLAFSILGFVNQIYSCTLYNSSTFKEWDTIVILDAFFILTAGIMLIKHLYKKETAAANAKVNKKEEHSNTGQNEAPDLQLDEEEHPKIMQPLMKLDKKDWIAMLALTLLFTGLSLPRLGSHQAPQTTYSLPQKGDEIVIDLGQTQTIDHMSFFLGRKEKRMVKVTYSTDKKQWQSLTDGASTLQSVFAWNNVDFKEKARYIKLQTEDDETLLNELCIVGENEVLLQPINKEDFPQLFDEQSLYKTYPTYYDQTYFDEVYHARSAYEYIHGDIIYENTHPPLGKLMISVGIRLFGMNPFGWRIVVELFGIFMIPLMYIFAKRLLKERILAIAATFLLTMDFMHFTLSKIATLDIIMGFLILLMYALMYQYISQDFLKTSLKKSWIPLGLCGIIMGVGVATKWTGVYAGAGLGILFVIYLIKSYWQSKEEKAAFKKRMIGTLAFCLVFFVVLPSLIYCLSYIPFRGYRPYNGLLDKVFDNMKSMLDYHTHVGVSHPYGSRWYEWAWMKRPLYMAVTHRNDGMGSAISCFGNPLIWWPGIIAVLYCFKRWLWEKDQKAGFLCISYSAQLVPWLFVTRDTFIYHYFPCSLFTLLCLGYAIGRMLKKYQWGKKALIGYMAAAGLCFVLFYPVISGMWINEQSARLWLKWLSGWTII